MNEEILLSKYYCSNCGAWPLKAMGLCQSCYDQQRYRFNKTKKLAQMKAWRERNPDYMREYNKRIWQEEVKLRARRMV